MLTIRLQRSGKKNKPEFRVVLAQKTAAAGKKFIEVLGNYNPRTKAFGVKSEDRLKYWIAQHVELSPTIHNLLVSKNLLDAKKVRAFNTPKKKEEAKSEANAPQASAAPATDDAQPAADDTQAAPAAAEEQAPAPVSEPEAPQAAPEEPASAPEQPTA